MKWLLLLLLTGCTTYVQLPDDRVDSDLPMYYVDSSLVKYLAKFRVDAKAQGYIVSRMPVTMIFGKTQEKDHPHSIGWCSVTNGKLFIRISRSYFFKSDELEREELVYHELAHCLAGRDHCNYVDPKTKRYVSIMSENTEPDDHKNYKEHRDEYIRELFHIDPHCT